ncbi:AMP-binding protein [Achromobacter sp. NPDC058515]|uniref:AMP-binding protein n=1 Tax=Achromobacter sp. NPDC058515 TaxID=3346533 RepID=UPI00366A1B76
MDTLRKLAQEAPDKVAAVLALSSESVTFQELDEHSATLAVELAAKFAPGEVVAVLLGNSLRYIEVCFAARRSGLYYVPISTHLTPAEIEYIIRDSGAKVLFTSQQFIDLVSQMEPEVRSDLAVALVDAAPPDALDTNVWDYCGIVEKKGPVPDLPGRPLGLDFAYSSGTTGKPKGIKHNAQGDEQMRRAIAGNWLSFFNLDRNTVFLSPAPLYHAAPLRFVIRTIANGGTAVIMQKFDAEKALLAIQTHKVTHSQWVPTMFVRLLALPFDARSTYDLSSHQYVLHAAAPCPIDVKNEIISWWGPIVWEYYTGSERAGATVISSAEWLLHPGSVGKAAQGVLHIVNDEGEECRFGQDGLVCFENGPRFEYHNDPKKTAEAYSINGWATFGDIGHVNEQGYLFLTDRRANMIISGGVNIYPQEAENVLATHPLVKDVAVIGVPNPEFGEEVKAVVELYDAAMASDDTAQHLIQYCRRQISPIKCPRTVDFDTALPRTDTGKLLKRLLRDRYK